MYSICMNLELLVQQHLHLQYTYWNILHKVFVFNRTLLLVLFVFDVSFLFTVLVTIEHNSDPLQVAFLLIIVNNISKSEIEKSYNY